MHRRATLCQAANNRYAEGLAAIQDQTPLKEWTDPLCQRALAPGHNPQKRKVRALNPLSPDDAGLLEGILDPKFVVNGLRTGIWSRCCIRKHRPTRRNSAGVRAERRV